MAFVGMATSSIGTGEDCLMRMDSSQAGKV
jgi:hypothetical protein